MKNKQTNNQKETIKTALRIKIKTNKSKGMDTSTLERELHKIS